MLLNIFAFLGYIIMSSSLFYLIITKNFGTPLKDSLTPDQLKIKFKSVKKRRRSFYYSFFISLILFSITYKRFLTQ